MPLTFPAHQAIVLPLKLWRPSAFDASALCVAAAAPDLAYPLRAWVGDQSHTAIGLVAWVVPFTLVVCALLRWRAAAGLFAHLPDLGPLRLRSYRVLTQRRPLVWITLASAVVGGASHMIVDGFTHNGRWGADWLGLDHPIAELPLRGEVSAARGLQYVGHVGGTIIGVALFAEIGRRRLLERWYGAERVGAARAVTVAPRQRLMFWAVALAPPAAVAAWMLAHARMPVFATLSAAVAGLLVAGLLPLYREDRRRTISGTTDGRQRARV